jgi:hypothetical protein
LVAAENGMKEALLRNQRGFLFFALADSRMTGVSFFS